MNKFIVVNSDNQDPVAVFRTREEVDEYVEYYQNNLKSHNFILEIYEGKFLEMKCFEQGR